MEAVTTLPRRALTVDDLDTMPDDGHRYELIAGALVVTPAPSASHQTVVLELAILLRADCPPDLQVFIAPFDVVLGHDTSLQPHVLVARRADLTPKNLPAAPVLAIEILSPSTRLVDLNLKKAAYERAGVPSYWVVDPDELRLVAFELRDGAYAEIADVPAGATWTSTTPYPVTLDPGTLAD